MVSCTIWNSSRKRKKDEAEMYHWFNLIAKQFGLITADKDCQTIKTLTKNISLFELHIGILIFCGT